MSHYKPDPNKSVNLSIDGFPVTVPEGTRILEAARKANIKIPTLCDCPGMGKRSVCRLCVVKCDGRDKPVAACAYDVWEGASIVTNSADLAAIRKMIVELLLANHPQECLTCIRNKKCELQSLAADFGIRKPPFSREAADRRPSETEGETLVRDMAKCIKCGRCVEVCQEVQTVKAINSSYRSVNYEICTPYRQALIDGPCVFCGRCAAACPVGAIYEYDQSAEVWAALNDSERHVTVQISAAMGTALESELGLPPGTVTGGRMVTVLKSIGFDTVFDSDYSVDTAVAEDGGELLYRINNSKKLPMITGCTPGLSRFIERFYPGLLEHLAVIRSPQRIFGSLVKTRYPKQLGLDPSRITTVSVMPCISFKFEARKQSTGGLRDVDIVLSTRELARMILQTGIDFNGLPESPFDCIKSFCFGDISPPGPGAGALGGMEAVLRRRHEVYTGKRPGPVIFKEPGAGIAEAEAELQGNKVKVLIANGLANARTVMESILMGKCDAVLVEIKNCSSCDASAGSIKEAGRS